MKKPCPDCAGAGCARQERKDEHGRYEIRELCMTCIGWGYIEDPPLPPMDCIPKVPL